MIGMPFSCFFQRTRLVMTVALSCLLAAGSALAGDVPAKSFEVPCKGVSFAECIKLFSKASGLEVSYDQRLANVPVAALVSAPDPVAGLRRLLDSVGDGNYALIYDAPARRIRISSLGDGGETQAAAIADTAPAAQQPPKKLFPTDDDIRAANRPSNPNDEVVPGMTNRELKARAEKLDLQRPDPATPFFPSLYGEKSLTWGELQQRQKQVDQDKPVNYSLSDGSTVSAEKLKEYQAYVDTMHDAKAGQSSALPPASGSQGSPKKVSGEETLQ